LTSGDIWVSNHSDDTPAGTIAATFRVNSDSKFQKIGNISGTANSNLTASGVISKGKNGQEAV
jgi:hypothetical protein